MTTSLRCICRSPPEQSLARSLRRGGGGGGGAAGRRDSCPHDLRELLRFGSQALVGGYTRLKRWDLLTFDRISRWKDILLLWASSFEAGLKTKPTPTQLNTIRTDFCKYALLKAREFPGRVCYYDFECYNTFGLLVDACGSPGAWKNQVRHTFCSPSPLPHPSLTSPSPTCVRPDSALRSGAMPHPVPPSPPISSVPSAGSGRLDEVYEWHLQE